MHAAIRASGGRTDVTTDVRKELVRSMSAEGLRPGGRRGACSSSLADNGGGAAAHVSPPMLRTSSSRAAAGGASERAPASMHSAEKGLMEMAFEVGSALHIQRGLFQPAEGPATILESLLKMQAR